MTLRVIEGWDFFPAGLSSSERERISSAKGYYCDTQGLVAASSGRFSFGGCVYPGSQFLNGNVVGYRIPCGVAVQSGYVGVACKVGAGGATGQNFVALFDGVNNTCQLIFTFLPNGIIGVYRASGTYYGNNAKVLIGYSDIAAYQEDEWFYLEVYGKIAASGGALEARINTKTVLSFPSVNTDSTGRALFDMIAIGAWANTTNYGNAKDIFYDDLYMCDTAGSANNSFLGNCRVRTQFAVGNGSPQDFAIGGSAPAATAWQSVLNTNLDDTKFIYDGTATHESLFGISPTVNAPTVFGTQVSVAARMDDATQRVLGVALKSGATTTLGVDHYINQTYTFYKDLWETNPTTGVGFTGADLNGMYVGPRVNV